MKDFNALTIMNLIADDSMTTEQVKAYLEPRLYDLDDSFPGEYIENAAVLIQLHHRGKSAADYFRSPAYIGFGGSIEFRSAHDTYKLVKPLLPASKKRPGVLADIAEALAEHFECGEQLDEIRGMAEPVYDAVCEKLNAEWDFDVYELSTVLVLLLKWRNISDDEDLIFKYAYSSLMDELSQLPGTDVDELCENIRIALDIITAVRERIGTAYEHYPLLCKASVMLRTLTDYEQERSCFENSFASLPDDFFDDDDDFDEPDLDDELSGSFSDLDLDDYFEDDDDFDDFGEE